MIGFAHIKAALAAEAPRAMGDHVIPITPIVFAAVTNYTWYNLKGLALQVSEYLVIAGHVLAFVTAAWAAYVTWAANRAGKASHMDAAKAAGTAAAAASKASPYVLILTALTLGGYLIYTTFFAKPAQAAPLAIMAAPAASGRKRKVASNDDAGGDDTDEPAEIPPGAPKWMVAAHGLLGTSERTSRGGSNPVISAMFEHTQLEGKIDARKVPWCAAFCNAMLERNGFTGSKSAMARSFLKWGVPLAAPRVGCIVVIWRGTHDDGTTGHVFFYTREDALYVYGIGGNQGDAVSEARFHKSKVLGYRWPRAAAKSKTNIGAVTAGVGGAGATAVAVTEVVAPEAAKPAPLVAEVAAQAIGQAKEPLQQVAGALHGTAVSKYIIIACGVLALLGAGLALYGRYKVRQEHGV